MSPDTVTRTPAEMIAARAALSWMRYRDSACSLLWRLLLCYACFCMCFRVETQEAPSVETGVKIQKIE